MTKETKKTVATKSKSRSTAKAAPRTTRSVAVPRKNRLITLFAVIVIAGLAMLGLSLYVASGQSPAPRPGAEKAIITVKGALVCLPKKDTSGPQTQECLYGIKSGDAYYGIKGTLDPEKYKPNTLVTVTGALKPPAAGEIYNVVGVIEVASSKKD